MLLINPIKKLLLNKKVVFVCLFTVFLTVYCSAQTITLKMQKAPLDNVLKAIQKQSGYTFFYSSKLLEGTHNVSIDVQEDSLGTVLDLVFKDQPIEYEIVNKTIVVKKKTKDKLPPGKEFLVRGRVTDTAGHPLQNVEVRVPGTDVVTLTDEQGRYVISTDSKKGPIEQLVFSYVGYRSETMPIRGKPVLAVSLLPEDKLLDQVVVIAYGKAKRQSITGSVSSISAEEIERRPLTTVTGALEGMDPGIQVNNAYGQPGSSPSISIRGFSSVNGSNTPLYVVDGVIFGGDIADLNPADIESISVLKDATSAALYGARASNGVIVITTKTAKNGTTSLEVVTNQGIYNRGLPEYDKVGIDDYMEIMWKGYRNSLMSSSPGKYPTLDAAGEEASKTLISDILGYNLYNKPGDELFDENGKLVAGAEILPGYKGDLDWFKPVMRNGYRRNYNISGSAATDKSNLYFSAGYLKEDGFVQRSGFERFNGLIKGSIKPKSWIDMGFNLSGSRQESNYISQSSSTGYANPIYFARVMAPIYPVHLHDAATGEYLLDETGAVQFDDGATTYTRPQNSGRNAPWELLLDNDYTTRTTLAGQFYASAKFLRDFTISTTADVNYRNSNERTYNNAIIGDGAGNQGRTSRTEYNYKIYTFRQQLLWQKQISDHNLTVLVAHENYSYNYQYEHGYKTTETFPGKDELINFTNITDLDGYQNNYTTESYLGTARYGYKDKYFADASYRRDGSSRFSPTHKWGNFWSVGGAWLMSKEQFMQSLDFITDLKLRGSYGEVGNDHSVDYYSYMNLYDQNQNANIAALYKYQYANPDLVWESENSLSFALEGKLFNRLNFTVEYFNKESHDLLFDVNFPLSGGSTSTGSAENVQTRNIGNVVNRGWEFTVNADIVRSTTWNWNLGLNATTYKNKILKLPEEDRENGIINGTKKYMEGHGIYDFWLYQYAGLDQYTGNSLYLIDETEFGENGADVPAESLVEINNKYYTTKTTYAKHDWSGSVIPKVYGGINSTLSWKNLSLYTLVTFSLGGKTYDGNYSDLMGVTANPHSLSSDLLNAWDGVPAGITETSADRIATSGVPAVNYTLSSDNNSTSTRFLQNGSYWVIKNIALSYKFPQRWMDQMGIRGAKLNLGVENLITFTHLKGMNPQYSFSGTTGNYLMTARVFNAGLSISL